MYIHVTQLLVHEHSRVYISPCPTYTHCIFVNKYIMKIVNSFMNSHSLTSERRPTVAASISPAMATTVYLSFSPHFITKATTTIICLQEQSLYPT